MYKTKILMLVLASTLFIGCGDDDNTTVGAPIPSVNHDGLWYYETISPYTGRIWLDRNMGASEKCELSGATPACYGDYYQWGRTNDGHHLSTSTTSATAETAISGTSANFIITWQDWSDVDADGTLRSSSLNSVSSNPICPTGYVVPTIAELKAETIGASNLYILDNLISFLALPAAGYRIIADGNITDQEVAGAYWSQDQNATGRQSHALFFTASSFVAPYVLDRAYGFPVRCIKPQ